MREKQRKAEFEAKAREMESLERESRLKHYLINKYEKEAREKNQSERRKAEREVQKLIEIVETGRPTRKTFNIINEVKNRFDNLYQNFELEIDILFEKSKSLDTRHIGELYDNLHKF